MHCRHDFHLLRLEAIRQMIHLQLTMGMYRGVLEELGRWWTESPVPPWTGHEQPNIGQFGVYL